MESADKGTTNETFSNERHTKTPAVERVLSGAVYLTQRIQEITSSKEVVISDSMLLHVNEHEKIMKSVNSQLKGVNNPLRLNIVQAEGRLQHQRS